MNELAYLDGAIAENQLMLDQFEERVKAREEGRPPKQIITQPMTYFRNRIQELQTRKDNIKNDINHQAR